MLRLLVLALVLDDPLNVLAAQVLFGYGIQPLPQARHELPDETPVIGDDIGRNRRQHLEAKATFQLPDPFRGGLKGARACKAGVDQDDQAIQARMDLVDRLDELGKVDAGLVEAALGAVAREEVEIAAGERPLADEGQDQRGLLL